MLKSDNFDGIVRQIQSLMPKDVQQTRQEIEKNVRVMIQATLQKMDLVTRKEFDIQRELLAKTRCLVDELEQKIRQLEQDAKKERDS